MSSPEFEKAAENQGEAPEHNPFQLIEAGSAIIDKVPGVERAELPDLNALPNMDKIAAQAERQRDAEDAYFSRGRHNPSAGEIVDMQVKTAQTAPEGLTGTNNPRTTVRLGLPRE